MTKKETKPRDQKATKQHTKTMLLMTINKSSNPCGQSITVRITADPSIQEPPACQNPIVAKISVEPTFLQESKMAPNTGMPRDSRPPTTSLVTLALEMMTIASD